MGTLPPELLSRVGFHLTLCDYSHLSRTCHRLHSHLFRPSELILFLKTRYRLSLESGSIIIFAYLANMQVKAPLVLERIFDDFFADSALHQEEENQIRQYRLQQRERLGHNTYVLNQSIVGSLGLNNSTIAVQRVNTIHQHKTAEQARRQAKWDAVRMLGVLYALDKTHVGPSSSTNALVLSGASDIADQPLVVIPTDAPAASGDHGVDGDPALDPTPSPPLFPPSSPTPPLPHTQSYRSPLSVGIAHDNNTWVSPSEDRPSSQFRGWLGRSRSLEPLSHGLDHGLLQSTDGYNCRHFSPVQRRGSRKRQPGSPSSDSRSYVCECEESSFSNGSWAEMPFPHDCDSTGYPSTFPLSLTGSTLTSSSSCISTSSPPSSSASSVTAVSSGSATFSPSVHNRRGVGRKSPGGKSPRLSSEPYQTRLVPPSSSRVNLKAVHSRRRFKSSEQVNEYHLRTRSQSSKLEHAHKDNTVTGKDKKNPINDRNGFLETFSRGEARSLSGRMADRQRHSSTIRSTMKGIDDGSSTTEPMAADNNWNHSARGNKRSHYESDTDMDASWMPVMEGNSIERRSTPTRSIFPANCLAHSQPNSNVHAPGPQPAASDEEASSAPRAQSSTFLDSRRARVGQQHILNREDKIAFLTKYTDRMHLKLQALGIKDWGQNDIQAKKTYQLMIQHNNKTGEKDLVEFYLGRYGGARPPQAGEEAPLGNSVD
ncbi:hypothetical protein BG004_005670 [Podila humilis]|nr:hypothetical protein BG004_005670 [Podila humilis]